MKSMTFTKNLTLVLFLGVVLWTDISNAFSSGAPPAACESLAPKHKNISPRTDNNPYTVEATKKGKIIEVKISSPYGEKFQGFVMQARSSGNINQKVEGKFSTRPGLSKATDCFDGSENTITHVDKELKSQIITEWIPASGVNEEVIFRASVAQTYQDYWPNIDSQPIRVSGAKTQSQNKDPGEMYENCFVNKGCFGLPPKCVPTQNCDIFMSYVDTTEGVQFEMRGSLSQGTYMATGLSYDREMGDDSVTECFIENNRVVAQYSWNQRRGNDPERLIPDGFYTWKILDGMVSCSWTRPYVSRHERGEFNITNNTYYVLMATGPVDNGRVSYHTKRTASESPVNFTRFEMIDSASADVAVKVHGAFMITGWVAFVSIAILMARHFKTVWDDKMLFGVKVWFAIHRTFMIIALLFIIVAFIIIFVHRKGWSNEPNNPHAVLGVIATALGVFQPIMAAFRPSPDHPKRRIFNWAHWGVGNGAQILAIVTIFFAVSLEASGLEVSFYWVMGVFVIVHYCVHLIFQLHGYSIQKKIYFLENNEMKMQEMGSGRVNNIQSDKNKSLPANVFKVLLLGIYGIFLIVIMLALYSLIGTA